jgi:hypothetical protein
MTATRSAEKSVGLWGNFMPSGLVNLDALIPRGDFEYDPRNPPKPSDFQPIKTHDLKQGSSMLFRKPDFQRETSHWSPEQVCALIEAFANEDLVPSVILWRSALNEAFVIDGAHRLSSLIAWVNNDYGDGAISQQFFGLPIPPAQQAAADATRKLVHAALGPFHEIDESFRQEKFIQRYREISARLNFCSVVVQTLRGDTDKAEDSFYTINKQGVKLDGTELTLLYSRNCPNAVAARAINQNGTGHPHWKKFESQRAEIEQVAKDIHKLLFVPPLTSSVVRSTDVPIGGKEKAAGVLAMLLNTVNIANALPGEIPSSKDHAESLVPPDMDGTQTTSMLKRVHKLLQRLHSLDACSLGLDPFVYVYSPGGRHLPSSYLAVIEFLEQMEREGTHKQFSRVRSAFEDFLVANSAFIPQIVRKLRGEMRAVHGIYRYFTHCFMELQKSNTNAESLLSSLQYHEEFSYLKPSAYESTEYGKDFSSEVKSGGPISHHLTTAMRCEVCEARIDPRILSFDHRLDKEKGGIGTPENRGHTHPYCNHSKPQLLPFFASNGGLVKL